METTAVATLSESQVIPGFGNALAFELVQRQAKLLASSDLVPKEYKGNIANCVIAMEMASRMGANPLMVMQNLYIVHGKPSWSSQFLIAALNSTQRFSSIRFELTDPEPQKTVTATLTEYVKGNKQTKQVSEKICNRSCVAWAIDKATGEKLESPPVSLEMAVIEGWYSKSGSKWQTMPDLMLRYRAATFFCRLYAPEVTMGFQTAEEVGDIIDITPEVTPTATAEDVMSRFRSVPVEDAQTKPLPNIDAEDNWPAPPGPDGEIPMSAEERSQIEAQEQELFREPGEEG